MNGDHNPQGAAAASTNTPFTNLNANRASPFAPTTASAAAAKPKMAASNFNPQSQAFRVPGSSQPPFPLSISALHSYDRSETTMKPTPVGTPLTSTTSILIRRLPMNTSEEQLRLMLVFAEDLAQVDVLPVDQSRDAGFRSAFLNFRSSASAIRAKEVLDGKLNPTKDAEMIVEILPDTSASGHRGDGASTTSSNGSSGQSSRQPSRFNGGFAPMGKLSPPIGFPTSSELPNPETSNHYKSLFSPQSPIGNHLSERPRISGKSLINNDSADDDETGELIRDPVAYAENGASAAHRRAPAPRLPISQMSNLSLNTAAPGPAMSPYGHPQMGPMSAHSNTMSPVTNSGHGMYAVNHHYGRHNFPPVNPADQNPPCNTLYVGNLPVDTSEEELKAMFSKQRGYKRLCFRTKQNGPMCFVEFEDVSFATKALHELYGHPLHNSVKGGIRLSFSKNPLGVRSGQNTAQSNTTGMGGMGSSMAGHGASFTTANGPPPGLSAPPGLAASRMYSSGTPTMNGGIFHSNGFSNGLTNNPWNSPPYGNSSNLGNGGSPSMMGSGIPSSFPAHMMGR